MIKTRLSVDTRQFSLDNMSQILYLYTFQVFFSFDWDLQWQSCNFVFIIIILKFLEKAITNETWSWESEHSLPATDFQRVHPKTQFCG